MNFKNFWISFAINTALEAVSALLMVSNLNPTLKADIQAFITAGQKLSSDITNPSLLGI